MVIVLPPRKQKTFLILGVTLIVFSLIILSVPTTVGILSPERKSPGEFSRELSMSRDGGLPNFDIVPSAFADESQEVAHFRLVQRRAIMIEKQFGGDLGVYLGDVHLIDPSRIVLFEAPSQLPIQREVDYEKFIATIPRESIISDTRVSDGKSLKFRFKDKEYHITAHFSWYLFGEDYGEFKVFSD